MPVFEFRGFDVAGKAVKGVRDADSAKGLRALLKREGVLATEVKESGKVDAANAKTGVLGKEVKFTFLERVSTDDLALATRQLATLLQAGVPMVDSLTALIDQTENQVLKRILSKVKTDVNEGMSLGDAFAKHKPFDHIYVNMVRAGESSGTLDVVLERLADFKEGQARIQGEIISALMYPVVMVFVGIANIGILFTVVIPKITRMFENSKIALPIKTQILILISTIVADYWWLLLIIAAASVWLVRRWLRTPLGRERWDAWKLKLPVAGSLVRMIAVARFSRTLGTLLQSGVALLTALDIVKNVVANAVLLKVIETVREAVREGEDIAPPLKRSGEFPPMVTHMVAIGEKSGQLEQMLERVAKAYEQRVDARMKGLMSLLAPALILVMAGAVGFVVFAILEPILQMSSLARR
jgi:general secretion pathway protein F